MIQRERTEESKTKMQRSPASSEAVFRLLSITRIPRVPHLVKNRASRRAFSRLRVPGQIRLVIKTKHVDSHDPPRSLRKEPPLRNSRSLTSPLLQLESNFKSPHVALTNLACVADRCRARNNVPRNNVAGPSRVSQSATVGPKRLARARSISVIARSAGAASADFMFPLIVPGSGRPIPARDPSRSLTIRNDGLI